MVALGIILVLVGFAIVVPRGVIAGSASARHVDMGLHGVHRTPGYQESPAAGSGRRGTVYRIVAGLALMGAGALCIAFGGS